MAENPTTIRLSAKLKKAIAKIAEEYDMTFSQVVAVALEPLAKGEQHLFIGITKYPPSFIRELEREAEETYRLYKEGKIKGYDKPGEAMDALLKEAREYNA